MQLLTAHWPVPSLSLSRGSSLSSSCFIFQHDTIWCEMSSRSVGTRCPGFVRSQLLVLLQLLIYKAGQEAGVSLALWALLSNDWNVLSTLFSSWIIEPYNIQSTATASRKKSHSNWNQSILQWCNQNGTQKDISSTVILRKYFFRLYFVLQTEAF